MTTTALTLPANLPPAFRSMIEDLTSIVGEQGDALGTSIQIADAILAAALTGDETAIFDAADAATISGEDFVDVPFMARNDDIMWRPTAESYLKEGAFPFYALIRTEDEDGKTVVVNCGGQSTVPTLYGLWKSGVIAKYGEDGMPLVFKTKKTAANWDLLLLRKYDAGKKK